MLQLPFHLKRQINKRYHQYFTKESIFHHKTNFPQPFELDHFLPKPQESIFHHGERWTPILNTYALFGFVLCMYCTYSKNGGNYKQWFKNGLMQKSTDTLFYSVFNLAKTKVTKEPTHLHFSILINLSEIYWNFIIKLLDGYLITS